MFLLNILLHYNFSKIMRNKNRSKAIEIKDLDLFMTVA